MKHPNIYGDFKTCMKCGGHADLIDKCLKTEKIRHFCADCWALRFLKHSIAAYGKYLDKKELEEEQEWLGAQPVKEDHEYSGGKAYKVFLSFFQRGNNDSISK
tara:strand:- start:8326 stop:8634 length:309 start_codon:yes stop_codon:yes gene_type:complete